jgi:dTDP-4-dehydrorhamnose reductase
MVKRKIAVIGASGQLGGDVAEAFSASGAEVCGLDHAQIELASADSVSACLEGLKPEIIVNTAAMHHVENCEREVERALAVNAVGARHLGRAAQELGATLIHLSTDYVFDGKKNSPYRETDMPWPLNVYGASKLAGEHFVLSGCEKSMVLRTSALYGRRPCRAKGGKNFVDRMLELGRERGEVRVVASERVSPTSTRELAGQIVALSEAGIYGLFHATAEGECSWHEFACEIFRTAHLSVSCLPAGPDEFPNKVPRPPYSVLENEALKRQGLNRFHDWRDGLYEYLAQARAAVA